MSALADDLLTPEMVADPYPGLHRLRAEDPVHWSERHHAWLVTRYDDAKALLRDSRVSADRVNTFLAEKVTPEEEELFQPIARLFASWMVFKDPPDHRRIRGLVSHAFTGRMVEKLSQRVEELVDELLSPMLRNGGGDFLEEFAAALPALVIARMIGVPEKDCRRFRHWASEIKPLVFGTKDAARHHRGREGLLALEGFFRVLLDEARLDPADDLLGAMIRAEESGDRLTNDEIIGNLILILFAGHETTTNLLASGLLSLLRNPTELDELVSDADVLPTAIEELLRFDGPSKMMPRYVTDEIELRGKKIHRGQRLLLVQAAANRDPERFEAPDRLDLTRPDNDHIAFGFGIHHCLGAPLARLEGNIVFRELRRHLPRFELASDELRWHDALIVRSLTALPVKVRS
jgi:cytochrome P450